MWIIIINIITKKKRLFFEKKSIIICFLFLVVFSYLPSDRQSLGSFDSMCIVVLKTRCLCLLEYLTCSICRDGTTIVLSFLRKEMYYQCESMDISNIYIFLILTNTLKWRHLITKKYRLVDRSIDGWPISSDRAWGSGIFLRLATLFLSFCLTKTEEVLLNM